jgi:DNA-binding Xre family transcriptional regulator
MLNKKLKWQCYKQKIRMKNNIYTEKVIGRLEEYVAKRGDNFAQLTKAIGVSVGYFSRMRKVKGSLGAEVLARILMYYSDLSADWLLTGQGTMLKGYPPTRHVQTYAQREKTLKEMDDTIKVLEHNVATLRAQKATINQLLH